MLAEMALAGQMHAHGEQALAAARQAGSREREGSALGNLGLIYQSLSDLDRAEDPEHLVDGRDARVDLDVVDDSNDDGLHRHALFVQHEARGLLAKRKKCRLLEMPSTAIEPKFEFRSVAHSVLKQSSDFGDPPGTPEWKVVSRRAPTKEELRDLRFAWKACQFVKSNAIVFAHGESTVGIGGGQPNRVDCVRIAAQRARERAQGAVMASDAFFPFPDSVQVAAEAGISAAVHPGGSIRDSEAIAAADAADMAMVVTGVRHFRH